MPIEFRENSVLEPVRRTAIECAISQEIGQRPGRWIVDLHGNQGPRLLDVTLIGPDAFGFWHKSFPRERITLRGIKEAVREALRSRTVEQV